MDNCSSTNTQALKWQGKVRAKVKGPTTSDQAWSHLKDFHSLYKWIPSIHTCLKIQDLVRYCAGPVNRSGSAELIRWSKERLLELNQAGWSYTYEIVENNKGFGRYVATIGVVDDDVGCSVEWGVVGVEPLWVCAVFGEVGSRGCG